ncbi:MAG: hypothetical protein FWC97_06340 [Treponema sp.]|nr:hypothetical protein [Treponema sp.]
MNRIASFVLNIAVALYLFANGILGITQRPALGVPGGEFGTMVATIFGSGDLTNILTIVLSICAIVAGVFLLLKLFNVDIRITDMILFVFVIVWVVFIVIVDIIRPIQSSVEVLPYLKGLASHLMVLGALMLSTQRFGNR